MENPASNVQQLAKLSPRFARSAHGRALIQATSLAGNGSKAMRITREELCSAIAAVGTFDDPYR
jgi:hypothetical protein